MLSDLIRKYKVKPSILKLYDKADKTLTVNDDPDLIPIKVPLPKAPDYRQIEGFGLTPDKQYFRKEVYPLKLRDK